MNKIKYVKAHKTDKRAGITEGKIYNLITQIDDPAQTPGVFDRHIIELDGDEGPVSCLARFPTDKETADSIYMYSFSVVREN